MSQLKDLILKYALQNSVKFDGKPNIGAVIGKLISEDAALKTKIAEVQKEIKKTISEISKLTVEQQLAKLQEIAPELLEKKEKKKRELPELPGAVDGKIKDFVTRIPPEPSKYAHIGHALSFLLNYMYAKKYNGKCIMRFEDTNPETCKQEYVDAMIEDVTGYLEIKPDRIFKVSEDMDRFYEFAEKLVALGNAYVCFCARENMQELRHAGKECSCRQKKTSENLEAWHDMLAGNYEDGVCVLRLKGDMEALNHVMRDPVLFRMSREKHYSLGEKYFVWPMYDFENAVEDSISETTHILRSNEFGSMRVELQDYIKKLLGFSNQINVEYGRFAINGTTTKGREIRELIEKKLVAGWDDPRLVTLKAMKRRGFLKETFYELAVEVGLTPSPTNLDWSIVESINRKSLDPVVHRHFFVEDPVEIKIENAPKQEVELNLHPENKKGGRKFSTHDLFYVARKDFEELNAAGLYRLMDCANFTNDKKNNIVEHSFLYHSREYEQYKNDEKSMNKKIMHWLPADDSNKKKLFDVEILMSDGSIKTGVGESNLKDVKVGEIIQFERFGFCKLEKIEKGKESNNNSDKENNSKLFFIWTHK
ncbi:TPA: glutamate--tRNA ligase [Candidatus Woesearchaeota archaeon]|nr:glutamate--tRNA ligase [Candidatus Woesearchaeota archaeon]